MRLSPAPAPTAAPELDPEPTRAPKPEPAPDPRGEEALNWAGCDSAECSTISVPIDYNDTAAGSIEIAVSVHRAAQDGEWLGYLFVNPGGPGGSGIEFAAEAAAGGFTPDVLGRFDIIGFDPRGVGASEPTFSCGDGARYRSLCAQIEGDVDTEAEIAVGAAIAALCGDAMGPVGNQLQSENVARDMDEIRKALGAEQISYYGASYGSVLGVWYATLFPASVRAMVIDGADNPIVEQADDIETQLENALDEVGGFEAQLEQALAACVDDTCPIYNNGDPAGYLTLAAAKADMVREASLLPLIGAFVGNEIDLCPFLGDLAPAPLGRALDGSDVAILVIGNTSDPATPYIQSEQLAQDVLSNGYLVRVDHPSHVVYPGGANQCVSGYVDAMLIEMTPPGETLVECAREEAPALTSDDVPAIIEQTCVDYAADVVPDADDAAVSAACSASVEPTLESIDAEVILSFLDGENIDRIEDLLVVFDTAFAEAGLS